MLDFYLQDRYNFLKGYDKGKEEIMKLYDSGVYLVNGTELVADDAQAAAAIKSRTGREVAKAEAAQGTIAYGILKITMYPAIWTSCRSSLIS